VRYQFVDYDPVTHRALDDWRSESIDRFAMDNPISEEWQYYVDSDDYRAGGDAFCKVVLLDGRPVAVMIVLCGPEPVAVVNPIIVAPELAGQGIGGAVLREFAECFSAILPFCCGRIEALIDNNNIASKRAFTRAGFTLARAHPDGDSGFYEMKI
jgi:RimJ/RimL family protein N-acetyltransferase